MPDGNLTNFRAVYDELTDEVMRARHQFLPDHLTNWFRTIDETPDVALIVQSLQSDLSFEQWWQARGGLEVSNRIQWPSGTEQALGMKLLLFRAFAEKRIDISLFGYRLINVGRDVNMNAHAVVEQIFFPMARELRRYLEGKLADAKAVPASDRHVPLDHNSQPYRDLINALEKLEHTLRVANDYPGDDDERGQRVAEVGASRQLLTAKRVRTEALKMLLKPLVVDFATKLKDSMVGSAVSTVMQGLKALFGYLFS
jgi:hypothetical protein